MFRSGETLNAEDKTWEVLSSYEDNKIITCKQLGTNETIIKNFTQNQIQNRK